MGNRKSKRRRFDRLCTVTLQGGGLYGFGLLGQLEAVRILQLEPIAYAGTSAGGIVAALAWAGYSPGEIKAAFKDKVTTDIDRLAGDPLAHSVRNPSKRSKLLSPSWISQEVGNVTAALAKKSTLLKLCLIVLFKALAPILRARGLYSGDGMQDVLDDMLRNKLREAIEALDDASRMELVSKIEAPDIRSSEFLTYRPTFRDFFFVHYGPGAARLQPALILSVTNLARRGPLFIDSLRSAFEHLAVSDVVMATAAFPVVFRPRTMKILRDKLNNFEPATRASLARHFEATAKNAPSPLELSEETFVDGGVVANFPIWAIAKYVRQTLYGRTVTLPIESLRIADDERFVVKGKLEPSIPDAPGRLVEMGNKDDRGSFAPLRGLAFRPLVHLGLRLMDKEAAFSEQQRTSPADHAAIESELWTGVPARELIHEPKRFWIRLLGMLAVDTRSYFEEQAINESSRIPSSYSRQRLIVVNQRQGAVGWTGHLFDFNNIKGADIDRMFFNGREEALRSFENLEFGLPRPGEPVIKGRGGPSLRTVMSESRQDFEMLLRSRMIELECAPAATYSRARLYLLRGMILEEMYSAWSGAPPESNASANRSTANFGATPPTSPHRKLCIDLQEPFTEDATIERNAFENRRSIMAFPKTMPQYHASQYLIAKDLKAAEIPEPAAFSLVFPIADLTERSREPLPYISGRRRRAASLLRRLDRGVYHWNEKTDAVLFGVYVLEFYCDAKLDHRIFSDQRNDVRISNATEDPYGTSVRLTSSTLRACIRSANSDAETISELLTRRFPGFEYDLTRETEEGTAAESARTSKAREAEIAAMAFKPRRLPAETPRTDEEAAQSGGLQGRGQPASNGSSSQ